MQSEDDLNVDTTDLNEDAAKKEELRDLMENVGGSADESDDRLADSFGSETYGDGASGAGRRIGLPDQDA